MNWRTVTGSQDPRFLVKGVVLSHAPAGKHRRFLVEEVRAYDEEGNADRVYRIRDAHAAKDGAPAPAVATLESYDDMLRYVANPPGVA
jgi:hypothetical protein